MRRPSPALVISIIALVGAWGGPAVASKLITSRDIKDRSIKGRDIASNTLTGRVVSGLSARDFHANALDGSVIDESTLDIVPDAQTASSATHASAADTAGHADVANTLAGAHVFRLAYARLVNNDVTSLFDEGGLRLQAHCTSGGTLAVEAVASNSAGGLIHVSATHPGSNGTVAAMTTDNDLRPGDMVSVLPAGADNASGTIAFYNPAGDAITIDYLAQQGLGAARGYQCLFAGTAVHATP